jgi:peptidoglycan/LPS O-acetylase OafA/YrhL
MANESPTPYRPDIDGLRAVAVLTVLAYHAFPEYFPGGFIGVDVFFVISGYLITSILVRSQIEGSFSYRDFYSRRIRRIFPALVVVILTTLLLGWALLVPAEYAALSADAASGIAFVANIAYWRQSGYFDTASELRPLLHLWSLSVEEQFYLVWPVVLALFGKRVRSLLIALAVLSTLSLAANLYLTQRSPAAAFYLPVPRFWELSCGGMLACAQIHLAGFRLWLVRHRHVVALAGSALLFGGFALIDKHVGFPGPWALLPVLGTTLLLAAGPQSFVNLGALSRRWLVAIGLISYPAYLWHWPLLAFARIVEGGTPSALVRGVLVVSSLVLAAMTYVLLEKRLRRLRSGLVVPGLVLSMTALFAAGLFIRSSDGLPARPVATTASADLLAPKATQSNPRSACDFAPEYPRVMQLCRLYRADGASKTVLLWGDSTARAWAPVFLDVGKRLGYTIVLVSHPSCPPVIGARKTRFDFPESREYCADGQLQQQVVQAAGRLRPDVIFYMGAFTGYGTTSDRPGEYITDEPSGQADFMTTRTTLERRLPQTLRALNAAAPVVVVRSWPMLPDDLASTATLADKLQRRANRHYFPTTIFQRQRRFTEDLFDHLRLDDVRFFDPAARLCSDRCSDYINETRMYADSYHVTPQGAQLYADDIVELLRRPLPAR